MGKIYTSYFANWRNFPEGSLKLGITRFPPDYWKDEVNIAALAPSVNLLRQYKDKFLDEYIFKQIYMRELEDRGLTPSGVRQILNDLAKDRDVILCCYERPEEFCHRHILAEWLGEDVKELE